MDIKNYLIKPALNNAERLIAENACHINMCLIFYIRPVLLKQPITQQITFLEGKFIVTEVVRMFLVFIEPEFLWYA